MFISSYNQKIMMCLWLITHRALLVGTWDKGPNVDRRCSTCGQLEINSHCLWECREVAVVCGTTLHLLCHASSSFILTWGHAWWNYLKDDVAKYDNICKAMYRGENGTVWLITDNRVLQLLRKSKNLGIYGRCLHPLPYGAYGQQGVPRYFQQTNTLQPNRLS